MGENPDADGITKFTHYALRRRGIAFTRDGRDRGRWGQTAYTYSLAADAEVVIRMRKS